MRMGLRPSGSDIAFHCDERWVEKDQAMVFTAEVKGRRYSFSIAADVLRIHFLSERFGRFQAFRENRDQIQEAATRRFEADDQSLRLELEDFTEAADFIPWERQARSLNSTGR